MNIYYHEKYNIDLGILSIFHPFDGKKFGRVFDRIKDLESIAIHRPDSPVSSTEIDGFIDISLKRRLANKSYILGALEIPESPFLTYSFIDRHILSAMRWGVSGTVASSRSALQGNNCWNLSGGYHHASRTMAEGFCIYNDIGIAVDLLTREKLISDKYRILIVDVDAHHGNGNAQTFMDRKNVTILDIYNDSIYPSGTDTKMRVDIDIPLPNGANGDVYLTELSDGLSRITGNFDMAYVIAGTDVLDIDPLGGLDLTIRDCVERDSTVLQKLLSLSTPAVFLGGGGYSKQSAKAIVASVKEIYKL